MNYLGRSTVRLLNFAPTKCQKRKYLAAVLKELQKPLVVEEIQKHPEINPKEVLVKVDAAGVNNADLLMVRGEHHAVPKLPFSPGFELAGEILAIGNQVKKFSVGDRVLALKTVGCGAFAQECIVSEQELFRLPYSLKYELAASLPVAYGTAMLALRGAARVKEGQTVLVLTSQGSTGLATIDLAINFFKCQVIAAADGDEKCSVIRPMGVLATCDYSSKDLRSVTSKYTEGKGVDIVIDTVGGKQFEDALHCIKPGGTLVTVGYSSGQAPVVSAQTLIQRGISVSGIWFGDFARNKPDQFHNIIEQLVEVLDSQFITPPEPMNFKLADVNQALEHVDKKTAMGKVLLIMR